MFQIISDGSCDLGKDQPKELNVIVVPFYVSKDGETYEKEIEELDIRDFYQFMVEHPKIFPKTTLPSIQDYVNVFRPLAEDKIDIICICITTKFSGSYNSAMNAKEIVLEDYPDANITVIDSTVDTVLQGILVEECAKIQKAGATYEEVLKRIYEIIGTGRIFFTVENMDYLVHGGRVGKLAGIASNLLNLRPLIVLKNGEIYPGGIARGRKKSKLKVMEQLLTYIKEEGNDPERFHITVGYGYSYEEALEFREETIQMLKTEYPNAKLEISMHQIGATIGVHTGPHPLGYGIIEKA